MHAKGSCNRAGYCNAQHRTVVASANLSLSAFYPRDLYPRPNRILVFYASE